MIWEPTFLQNNFDALCDQSCVSNQVVIYIYGDQTIQMIYITAYDILLIFKNYNDNHNHEMFIPPKHMWSKWNKMLRTFDNVTQPLLY